MQPSNPKRGEPSRDIWPQEEFDRAYREKNIRLMMEMFEASKLNNRMTARFLRLCCEKISAETSVPRGLRAITEHNVYPSLVLPVLENTSDPDVMIHGCRLLAYMSMAIMGRDREPYALFGLKALRKFKKNPEAFEEIVHFIDVYQGGRDYGEVGIRTILGCFGTWPTNENITLATLELICDLLDTSRFAVFSVPQMPLVLMKIFYTWKSNKPICLVALEILNKSPELIQYEDRKIGSHSGIQMLTLLMENHMEDPEVLLKALGVMNGTGFEYNTKLDFKDDGIDVLLMRGILKTIEKYPDDPQIIHQAFNASDIAFTDAKRACAYDGRRKLGTIGACEILLSMLKKHRSVQFVQIAGFGLLESLSTDCTENKRRFLRAGVCQLVVEALREHTKGTLLLKLNLLRATQTLCDNDSALQAELLRLDIVQLLPPYLLGADQEQSGLVYGILARLHNFEPDLIRREINYPRLVECVRANVNPNENVILLIALLSGDSNGLQRLRHAGLTFEKFFQASLSLLGIDKPFNDNIVKRVRVCSALTNLLSEAEDAFEIINAKHLTMLGSMFKDIRSDSKLAGDSKVAETISALLCNLSTNESFRGRESLVDSISVSLGHLLTSFPKNAKVLVYSLKAVANLCKMAEYKDAFRTHLVLPKILSIITRSQGKDMNWEDPVRNEVLIHACGAFINLCARDHMNKIAFLELNACEILAEVLENATNVTRPAGGQSNLVLLWLFWALTLLLSTDPPEAAEHLKILGVPRMLRTIEIRDDLPEKVRESLLVLQGRLN